jgi:class 3 adenylate cyclase
LEALSDEAGGVRTFLIADVRGYSRFTEEYGDEAAAQLSARFACLVEDEVEAHGGQLVEIRGDEALTVFESARQAIRAAVDLQGQFEAATEADGDLPIKVGIGIDSGEAVQLPDGTFRGAALNVAARLCGRAHGGEVIISEATSRLAGRLGGLHYSDRGRVRLKNISDPIHVYKVYSELDAQPRDRWTFMFFGKPGRTGRTLTWRLGALVALIAAATAVGVVYLTSGGGAEKGTAAPGTTESTGGAGAPTVSAAGLRALIPAAIWSACRVQTVAEPNADETAVCLPTSGVPDRWEVSTYPNSVALAGAYNSELRKRSDVKKDTGKCNAFFWGGELAWMHGPGKPGGRVFCYFDGDDAVIVWTHERLGQPTHRDMLAIAREGGSDHARLTRWWRPWHHLIGKQQ